MKKVLVTFVLLFMCQLVSAQAAASLFNDFRDKKHAEFVSAPRLVMGMVASKMKTGNMQALIDEIHSAKVLTLNGCRRSVRKKFVRRFAELSRAGYEEFSNLRQEDDNISVMARKGADNMIKEAVVLISDKDDCMGILVTGNINPEDVSAVLGTAD